MRFEIDGETYDTATVTGADVARCKAALERAIAIVDQRRGFLPGSCAHCGQFHSSAACPAGEPAK
jgi:hypothetical protein